LFSWSFGNVQQEIKIIGPNNSILGTVDYIKENRYYFSINDFSNVLLKKNFINKDLQKIVFSLGNDKIKVTGNVAFVIINDKAYQLKNNIIYKKGTFYAPIDDFLDLLNKKTESQYSINYNSLSIQNSLGVKNSLISSVDLKKEKKKWKFDTIIIDPGHGGKDPGAIGYRGTKEKDIALDVSKRLAKKIERNSKTKVILTREEDIFVRLKDRTKFANVNKGDLFISIHTNAAEDRRASGFETFLIGINKNEEAIRVAARENAVLELEDGGATKLTDEALIQATMSQAAFANLSEQFAALVQEEMSKRIQSKNRGVKQAGFYVLMGASMPNVLVELGFISNPNEEKKLNSSSYREILATSIYYAILKYQKLLND
tara:strand:+ start:433 stop:1551 length:1119 start_codon:yes stop_codon:yes gene_type:complete